MNKKSRVRRIFYDPLAEPRMEKIIRITNYIFERKQANDVLGLAQYLDALSSQELSIVEEEFETLLPILKNQRAWKEKKKKPFK